MNLQQKQQVACMPGELELKLAGSQDNISKIKDLKFPGIASQSPWEVTDLKNTYYDTAHFKLRDVPIGMRIREVGGRYIQTVKSGGKAVGGLHQRNEDEVDLTANQLDTSLITDPYLMILVEEAQEEDGDFLACFTTDFCRTRCELKFSDDTIIEVALDLGTISNQDQSVAISEVELELKQGSAEYIFAIGRYLIKELGLTLYNASKASRGYSLGKSPNYQKMQVTELSQGVESEMAFEKICHSGLTHWQHYELFLDDKNAHSAVLEMYRALIYLHHMYMVFGGLIPRAATTDLRNNWNWLAEAMRPIVDAAKHKRYLARYLEQKADWDLVEGQIRKIENEVSEAISDFKALLATQRYNLMMLNISQWLYFKEWRDFIPEKERNSLSIPIIDFAKTQLDHMLKDLKRDLGPKKDLTAQDYFTDIPKVRRALDTGLFFGGLFDSQKRLGYRKGWLEILAQIRELQVNDYIFELQLETHTREETEEWLDKRNAPILEKIKITRKAVFKSTPYWA